MFEPEDVGIEIALEELGIDLMMNDVYPTLDGALASDYRGYVLSGIFPIENTRFVQCLF